MSTWPDSLNVAPIRTWPGELTRSRRDALFSAPFADTLNLLDREIDHLSDTIAQRRSAELLVAIPAGALWRQDGRPRAHAVAEHPGVIFSIDSRHGHLSYPCDTFTRWQDNLRAIALALEALRKVDRYGVTKRGEQYRGFLALEATAVPAGFQSVHDAQQWCKEIAGYEPGETWTRRIFRDAQRAAHPDTGGSAAAFQRLLLAETKLRAGGVL